MTGPFRLALTLIVGIIPSAGPALAASSGDSTPADPGELVEKTFRFAAESDERFSIYHSLRENSISSCMAEAGLEYVPEPFSRRPGGAITSPVDLILLSVDQATDEGYGIEATLRYLTSLPAPPNDEIRSNLTPAETDAYEAVLYGTENAPGCLSQAEEAVLAEHPEYVTPSEYARVEQLIDDFVTDFQLRSADEWSAWSRCMEQAGFAYDTTWAAREDVGDLLNSGEVDLANGELHDVEFRTAIADANCQAPLMADLLRHSDEAQQNIFGTIIGTGPLPSESVPSSS